EHALDLVGWGGDAFEVEIGVQADQLGEVLLGAARDAGLQRGHAAVERALALVPLGDESGHALDVARHERARWDARGGRALIRQRGDEYRRLRAREERPEKVDGSALALELAPGGGAHGGLGRNPGMFRRGRS